MSGSKLQLKEVLGKYLAASGGYGETVPLSSFGLSREEIEDVFSLFDEDYHISRFFHFSLAAGASYTIDGFPQTHVSIDSDIQSIL